MSDSSRPTGLLSELVRLFFPVVVTFVGALLIGRSCEVSQQHPSSATVIDRDTVWVHHDSFVVRQTKWIERIPVVDSLIDTLYLPDTSYPVLLQQYQELLARHLAKDVYKDSLFVDSLGYVSVTDTVGENRLLGRSYQYQLSYPRVIEYVSTPMTTHLYGGGGISTNGIHGALLYQDIKQRLFGVQVGLTPQGKPTYSLHTYWKLK